MNKGVVYYLKQREKMNQLSASQNREDKMRKLEEFYENQRQQRLNQGKQSFVDKIEDQKKEEIAKLQKKQR